MAMSLGVIPGGKLLKPFGKFLGDLGASAWRGAKRFASQGTSLLGGEVLGFTQRAEKWVDRKVERALGSRGCGCFAAATMVWTTAGAAPIADLDGTQTVFAAPDDGAVSAVVAAERFTPIVVGEASLLVLTLEHADGSIELIKTTDEHPFHVADTREWTRADALQIADRLSTLSGDAVVREIAYGGERVPVYNLSISGSPTYYVGERGVWVHNCLTELEFESFVRQTMGSSHSFRVGGREFDGRVGGLWFEVKTSPISK